MSWIWIDPAVVLAVHDEQLAEHGGMSGIRDMGLLQSGLARPVQLETYGDPDVFDLAAAYAYGIAQNHPFVDGNKRTAYVVSMLFLRAIVKCCVRRRAAAHLPAEFRRRI